MSAGKGLVWVGWILRAKTEHERAKFAAWESAGHRRSGSCWNRATPASWITIFFLGAGKIPGRHHIQREERVVLLSHRHVPGAERGAYRDSVAVFVFESTLRRPWSVVIGSARGKYVYRQLTTDN